MITKPSWANAGYLLWDIAGTVLPYVLGSWTAKRTKAGVKALSRSHDATTVVKKVGSYVAKGTGNAHSNFAKQATKNANSTIVVLVEH